LGGTFTALPIDYQDWFVKRCLDAITGIESSSLREAIANAEVSEVRNSNMCTETRPDCLKERHIDQLLKLGMTRIELGVQTIYDDVYKLINRGHKVQDVVEAERHAKDSGFATIWHMMPALPGSNLRRDADMFQRIFDDPRFRPDMLKIYPCLVMDGTKLHKQWTKGEYEPYTLEEVIDLLAKVKARLPNWVRIMRIQRDIPSDLIRAGVKRGNLRQLVKRKMDELGLKCRCVRCREVGLKMLDGIEPDPESVKLKVERYEASGGVEFFLSFEDVKHDVLIGLLRLRSPSEEAHRKEVKEEACAIVRQLQVYGPLVKVGESPSIGEWQHRGYGRTLIEEGERIAREELDAKKVLILSGLGVRRYYRKLGYTQDGPYISKRL
jgi:elongator complex protein 3